MVTTMGSQEPLEGGFPFAQGQPLPLDRLPGFSSSLSSTHWVRESCAVGTVWEAPRITSRASGNMD